MADGENFFLHSCLLIWNNFLAFLLHRFMHFQITPVFSLVPVKFPPFLRVLIKNIKFENLICDNLSKISGGFWDSLSDHVLETEKNLQFDAESCPGCFAPGSLQPEALLGLLPFLGQVRRKCSNSFSPSFSRIKGA